MERDPAGPDQDVKDRILDATLDELRIMGVDNFTIENVAKRAGVDASVIFGYWHDWRVLLMDAQLTRHRQQVPTPSNGDLEADLVDYANSLTRLTNTAQGRRWIHRNLPNGYDTDFSEVRSDFWSVRFSELVAIILEATDRGEIRDGIDPLDALRAFSAALFYDPIFADSPVRPDFAAQVRDIFLHGILKKDVDRGATAKSE